ncbi:haloacid dehalogenase [Kallotenue papyrolyticum]|uniref:haloacid dehalogenase n=1 Tax=Kallotenue papyrolyticum TaxID=1325125 RepID=UPI0004785401|nr:haloacid dehalogenase [Kallotenue papyrolyticum]
MKLDSVVEAAIERLDATNGAREAALATSRVLIRQCANAIRAIHRQEWPTAQELLTAAQQTADELRARLADHPAILHAGYTQDAFKEYAEARLTYALVHGDELPSAEALGVEPAAYLNGLAEAASELRRYILDGLRHGALATGERLLEAMDDVYSLLVTVDYPDAVTGGLRRTTDALRAVLERTRGDLTTALRQERLMAAIAQLEGRLSAPEPEP